MQRNHNAAVSERPQALSYSLRMVRHRTQYEKYRHVLRHEQGGVERVIRGLRYLGRKHPRQKRINEVLGYFRRNRKRMDYAGAPARGLPIGPGVMVMRARRWSPNGRRPARERLEADVGTLKADVDDLKGTVYSIDNRACAGS